MSFIKDRRKAKHLRSEPTNEDKSNLYHMVTATQIPRKTQNLMRTKKAQNRTEVAESINV